MYRLSTAADPSCANPLVAQSEATASTESRGPIMACYAGAVGQGPQRVGARNPHRSWKWPSHRAADVRLLARAYLRDWRNAPPTYVRF